MYLTLINKTNIYIQRFIFILILLIIIIINYPIKFNIDIKKYVNCSYHAGYD